MILFADNLRRFWTRMDQNYRRKYQHLLDRHDPCWDLVDVSGALPDIAATKYSALLVGVFAALRSSEDPPGVCVPQDWYARIQKRCVMVEDLHPRQGVNLSRWFADRYNYLISTYNCALYDDLREGCPSLRQSWVIPHHIDTRTYRPAGRPKLYDVLLYGNTDPETYPFRNRLKDLLLHSPFAVKVIECPDVRVVDETLCGDGLAQLIDRSYLAIATPSRHDYLLAKYFEISACGAVVAGPMATQGRTIWGDRYLQLESDMSDAEILDRLTRALTCKQSLLEQGATMSEMIRSEYSLDRYVSRLSSVMEEIIADDD